MDDPIRNISDHEETVFVKNDKDYIGVSVPVGEIVEGVDIKHPDNARLLEEGRIITGPFRTEETKKKPQGGDRA